MEEVDAIIIHTLKSIGCDIENDVQSLQHFSTDLMVEGTSRFIKVIRHDIDLPYKLPPGMSARFRIGTSLAEAVKELGYRGEVGYQTFLYSNESDIRRVFMFLVEKLPKAGAETAEETMGGSEMLQRSIAHEISRRLKSPWTPPYCKSKGIAWRGSPPKWQREDTTFVHTYHADQLIAPEGLHDLSKRIPKERKSYYSHHLPLITNQPRYHHDVAPSVIETNAISFTAQQEWETEWNQGLASRLSPEEYKARKRQRLQKKLQEQLQQGMAASKTGGATQDLQSLITSISDRAASAGKTKGSRFTHTEKLQFAQDEDKAAAQMGVGEGPRVDTEEELQKKRQEEIEGLRNELQQLSSKLESLEIDIKKMSASKQQIEEQMKNIKTKNSEKEETYKVKKKTLDLLPDADNNIAKLQSMVDSSAQRLVNLANQWEKHRAPLIQQYRELKEVSEDRASEAQKKLEEIKELREKMKEVASEAKGKEDLYKQLVSEFERMTKDVNRSAYTRKIMEIVANIKKQKQEIDKVLIDTRAVQKEINQLSGKLDRTFTVTDELIFRDAKKEEAVRKAYKHLAALHENFNALIKTVEETGVIMREIRDLEDQIDIESKKKILSNLERITNDYQEMKKENTGLISKLKKQ